LPSECEPKFVKTIGSTGLFVGCANQSIYVIGNDSIYGFLGTNENLISFTKLPYEGKSIIAHGTSATIASTIISQTCLDDEVRVPLND